MAPEPSYFAGSPDTTEYDEYDETDEVEPNYPFVDPPHLDGPEDEYFRGHDAGFAQGFTAAGAQKKADERKVPGRSKTRERLGYGLFLTEVVGMLLMFPVAPIWLFLAVLVPSWAVVDQKMAQRPIRIPGLGRMRK